MVERVCCVVLCCVVLCCVGVVMRCGGVVVCWCLVLCWCVVWRGAGCWCVVRCVGGMVFFVVWRGVVVRCVGVWCVHLRRSSGSLFVI